MRMPHVQGGFREHVTVDASQAIPIADALSLGEAAMAEPLAVCLHAGRPVRCSASASSSPVAVRSAR